MKPRTTGKHRDPVCGLKIAPGLTDYTTVYEKHAYFFCSQGCLDRFKNDQGRFARGARRGIRGVWSRYLDRVQKATEGKPPCCH